LHTSSAVDTLGAIGVGCLVLQFVIFLVIFIILTIFNGFGKLLSDFLQNQLVRLCELGELAILSIFIFSRSFSDECYLAIIVKEARIREYHLAAIEVLGVLGGQ